MDKEYLKTVYDFLNDSYTDYLMNHQKRNRSIIETRVRMFAKGLKQELYTELNEYYGNSLFEPGFFESDLIRSITILKAKLEF